MAVQAQYSSKTRALVDKGNDYPSQSNLNAAWNKKRPREENNSVMHRHSHEIEQLLRAQVEQLRRTLTDKRQRQYSAVVAAAEEWGRRRLRKKEEEAEKGAKRNAELEASAAQVHAEVQVWRARARAQEAEEATLQAQVQHAVSNGGEAGDAESGCAEDEAGGCRVCKRQVTTVVMLPCRHLSVFCKDCDDVLEACPRCLYLPTSTMEVFLF